MRLTEHLIAHRGWQRHYPENTAAAVRGAIAAGALAVEVDVQLSAEGVPVLHHDRSLWRLCQRRGQMADYSWDELSQLRASEPGRLGQRFADEPLLSLAQLVTILQQHPQVHLFLEAKAEMLAARPPEAAIAALLDIVAPLAGRCTLISFSFALLRAARNQGWPALGPVLRRWSQRTSRAVTALSPQVAFIDWRRLPDSGMLETPWPLAVYEVDQRTFAEHLLARGVRWIETFAVGELLGTTAATMQSGGNHDL